jgi:hypothetical protein
MTEMTRSIEKEDKQVRDHTKEIQTAIYIAGCAAKVGLYAATAVLVYQAILHAAERAAERMVIPGGEIFTIPLIVALILVGWEMRGDVERAWRQFRREERRRRNGRR